MQKILPLIGLGLASLLGCAVRPVISAVRAKQDYDKYPSEKGNIALYNMARILEQMCNDNVWSVNEEGLTCMQSNDKYGFRVVGGELVHVNFSDIDRASAGACPQKFPAVSCVYFHEKNREPAYPCIGLTYDQARDLVEAVNIYLAGRK